MLHPDQQPTGPSPCFYKRTKLRKRCGAGVTIRKLLHAFLMLRKNGIAARGRVQIVEEVEPLTHVAAW